MLVAAVLSTGLSGSAKWLVSDAVLPLLEVVMLRYLVHFVLAVALFVPTRGVAAFRVNAPATLVARAAFLILGTVLNFWALKYLPLTLTTAILFAGPVVITFLAAPILGETLSPLRLGLVLVGFAGVVVIVNPFGASFHPAIFLSIGAVLAASLYYILTRKLAGVDSNAAIQLWSSGLAVICFTPFVIWTWQWPDDPVVYLVIVIMGTCGGLSHLSSTRAHHIAPAAILAPFTYAQILSATVVGLIVFGDWPTVSTLLGCGILIASGFAIWRLETRVRTGGGPPVVSPSD